MAKREMDPRRGVYMISVASELAGMHPQTLRIYEARGLIKPKRSPKQTRLYSQRDVEKLRRIEQVMTTLQDELDRMRAQAEELEKEMLERIQEVHRSYKRELVRWEPPGEI